MREQPVPVIRGGLALAAALLIAAGASCSSEPPPADMPDAMTAPDTTAPMACPNGYSQCGQDCAPLKRDPLNCGACGKACKAGEVCVQGGCALQCGGNATKCGAYCVNTKSDPDNCGMCAGKCPAGQVCSVGKCATSCQQGLTDCSGACIDLQTDDDNCGVCGNPCDAGQKCVGGKCTASCQQGWSVCPDGDGGTKCVDLGYDKSNCGTCGNQCPNGQFCSPGADGGQSTCGLACFGGTTKCGNKCVDLAIDPQNCGSCGTACNGTCFNGNCCSGNLLYCGGQCVDVKSDVNNCGTCGNKCVMGSCTNGSCPCPLKKQCDTGVDVTNSNLTWVVCQSDCSSAWVSMLSANGGMYHAEYICKQLGYAKLGQYGGTCGNVCGYCQGQTSCSMLGNKFFGGSGSCGSDQYGQILCNTVMWECTQ